MLAVSGFAMVAVFMTLIMTKRLSPLAALVLVPIVTAVLLGTTPAAIGEMALDGIKTLAPTGVMLMFAILFFGVMIDAGLFDPVVGVIVRLHNRTGGTADNIVKTYSDGTVPVDGPGLLANFNGRGAQGAWKLRVRDEVSGTTGTLNSWSLQ